MGMEAGGLLDERCVWIGQPHFASIGGSGKNETFAICQCGFKMNCRNE
jgi:hypothetical protein